MTGPFNFIEVWVANSFAHTTKQLSALRSLFWLAKTKTLILS